MVFEGKRRGESASLPNQAYVALTDRRILLIGTGWGLRSRGVETIPLDSILSVDGSRWFGESVVALFAPLRLNTSGGEVRIRVSPAGVADAIAEYIRARVDERQKRSGARESGAASALAKLAELHEAGRCNGRRVCQQEG